jgi:DNA-directed RNA polymerase subunit RPC12/RpoP
MNDIPFLPSLMPDEHIFGGYARLAYLSSVGRRIVCDSETKLTASRLGSAPIYNKFLVNLLNMYSQQKSTEELLKRHTPLGFYYHSMKYIDRYNILNQNDTKIDLYFPGSQLSRHSKKWRWCPLCAENDVGNYGTPYWHLSHQLPTTTTCPEHQIHLLYECSKCSFSVPDIKAQAIPPLKGCPKCSSIFSSAKVSLNEHAQWIQSAGIELLQSESPFLKPNYEYVVTYALDLLFAKAQKNSEKLDLYYYDRQQQLFLQWLRHQGLMTLFVDDIDLSKCKLLDICTIMSAPRKVPLISHLLWSRFMGVHSLKDAKRGFVRKSA